MFNAMLKHIHVSSSGHGYVLKLATTFFSEEPVDEEQPKPPKKSRVDTEIHQLLGVEVY